MSDPREPFIPGQRWISESEPELGLGLVVETDRRRVEFRFPAADETRTYAIGSAPVARVRYRVGDEIGGPGGQRLRVERLEENGGLITYHGGGHALPESEVAAETGFDQPEERLLAGQADEPATFALRLATLRRREELCRSPLRGFAGGKVELVPHQLYIAHEVSRRMLPRVLLSDEVGLGKTIEACLILHRLLVTGRIRRVLILVPSPLVHQWYVELLRRFNLNFSIYDEERCQAMTESEPGANVFLEEQRVLCSLDWLCGEPRRALAAAEAGWDLLIVDEAHHLRWSPDAPSPEYAVAEHLARSAPGLLLLTATPEQMGLESHFARLRLLDPHRYPDYGRFVEERARFRKVAAEAKAMLDAGDEKALRAWLDRHGPGRVIFRNTRSAMPGFPRRYYHPVPLARDPDAAVNPAVRWLADFLREHPDTKVLAICSGREEVGRVHRALQKLISVNTALFHEDLPLIQCDRQAAWFAEPDGARLLIASEIGGEGRNFQFVQHLVLLGLPDDPEMLEQRIGRLDRIGQTGDIHIHVPYRKGSPEEDRARWLHEGLDAFETPLVGGYELMQRFGERLGHITDALIKETRKEHRRVVKEIEAGRDRLLELNSFRPDVAAGLVQQIRQLDTDPGLEDYLLSLLDHFGVHAEKLSGRDYLLLRGHLFTDDFPLREEQLLVTLDRARAIAREDITLMSWDHPMVEGAMDLLLGSPQGNAAFALSESAERVALCAVFVLECVAPPQTGHLPFLPPTPIEVTLDARGQSLDGPPDDLRPGDVWAFFDGSPRLREALGALIASARRSAEEQADETIEQARDQMRQHLGGELARLVELRKVNDHVRQEEIDELARRIAALDEALGEARLRLDSILLVAPAR